MKKHFLNLIAAFGLLIVFSACSGDDTDNPNVIVDEEGVLIELTWSNSASDPTDGTSLALKVKDGNQTVFSSNNWFGFGEIEILNSALNNGTYGLDVRVDAIDRLTNYTITVTGLTSGKSYSVDFGPINANDLYANLQPLSLTISGTKYTVVY
ncbi:MAG: hypothetical protein JNN28_01165 [Saprospiraceae bacterium]|nr:hypothetical protein [Saprospiraceae bacterium]